MFKNFIPCEVCEYFNIIEGDANCQRCGFYRLWWVTSLLYSWKYDYQDQTPVREYVMEILEEFEKTNLPFAVESQGRPEDIVSPLDFINFHVEILEK